MTRRTPLHLAALAGLLAGVLLLADARAQVSSHTMTEFTSMPVSMMDTVTPLVMIATSQDHSLYFKAYNDYSDLDGDGELETTYEHDFDYYGYFDSYKCYDYDTTQLRFEPKATTTDKYCTGGNDSYWSGNFLNWATMTRIDAIRKILFGGHRRVDHGDGDADTETVLERTYLPHDAHSFAKYYNGTDINSLTPFSSSTGADSYTSYCNSYNAGQSNCNSYEKLGITFCNTTDASTSNDYSQEVSDPPLMKVMKGNYSLWAANERWQCTWGSNAPSGDSHSASNSNVAASSGIYANTSSPDYNNGMGNKNYVVRIVSCDPSLIGQETCKLYPSGNYKPIGLLQKFGDSDLLWFGMMAGTYGKHAAGGELVQDIISLSHDDATQSRSEINADSDGTFLKVASSAGGAESDNQAEGIVNAWSLYRPYGYYHGDGTYNNSGSGDSCSWGLSSEADTTDTNKCTNWGNPFSEIFFQTIRYLAGNGIAGDFRGNDSNKISGLNTPQTWDCPLQDTNSCAQLFVVGFNTSSLSYDNDDLDGTSYGVQKTWDTADLPSGSPTSAAMTTPVGAGEDIHGNNYFIGELDVEDQSDGEDQLCTSKEITDLGMVGGTCPEAPRLMGTYRIAGLAYYAHTKDIRPDDATGGRALTGDQTVESYTVAMATATPKLTIPHPLTEETAVTILPACRNTSLNPDGNCAVVDYKVVSQTVNDGTGLGTGQIYVNWEDSEQGGDYDQDMWGTLSYSINGHTGTITITTDVIAQSTGYEMGFGYVLSGTTKDGFHTHSGINNFDYTDSTGVTGCTNCVYTAAATSVTYVLGASTTQSLEDPLWYAAKWGGFQDSNGDNTPDLQSEWDQKDQDGNMTPDGIPDNFFYASDPAALESSLNKVFLDILSRTSSGTAAAVVSTTAGGEGAIFQAFFEPMRQDNDGNEVRWVGTLQALWIDSYGYMRQDDGDAALEGYSVDKVVEFFYDETENKTKARIYENANVAVDDNVFTAGTTTETEITSVQPLWNTREQMYYKTAGVDLSLQRAYADRADQNGRYIKTWIDNNPANSAIDTGEYIDFDTTDVGSSNYGFFDVADATTADNVVNFVRGVEVSGYRSRTVDYDGDGTTEILRLGDIVNSTPTVVAAPAEAFDTLYADNSYSTFRSHYANRRQVVYLGANDGMIHAINGGFFDAANLTFSTSGYKPGGDGTTPATTHPLGAEIWAYVPMNLLPHLKWLTETDYTHVFYMDAKPRVFDAKIFTEEASCNSSPAGTSCIHPEGWGTVMVVGMRLGGGPMTIDANANGLGNPNASDDRTMRSAYVVFDITNPEEEPTLLAEFQIPDNTYAMSYPTVAVFRDPSDEDPNDWYLVVGTGPNGLSTAALTGGITPKVYLYNLNNMANKQVTLTKSFTLSGKSNLFVGSPTTSDWDLDFKSNETFVGLIGDSDADAGGMVKIVYNEDDNENNWSYYDFMPDMSQPVFATPTLALDDWRRHWLFFGTGRYLVEGDKSSLAQQNLYGVMDQSTSAATVTVSSSELLDVTDIAVYTNDTLANATDASGNPIANISALASFVSLTDANSNNALDHVGWTRRLDYDGATPSERNISQMSLLGATLFATTYVPNEDQCNSEGISYLYGLYYLTGTAYPDPSVFGSDTTTGEANTRLELGRGLATTPSVHVGSGKEGNDVTVITQISTGVIVQSDATTISSGVRSGEVSWQEYKSLE